MKDELYDILLDSSRVDLDSSKIMIDTGQYLFSINLCFQSIVKLLNIISIHIENREMDTEDVWKGYVLSSNIISEDMKEDIIFVGETYEALNMQFQSTKVINDDILKSQAYEVQGASYKIMNKTANLLMGRNIMA